MLLSYDVSGKAAGCSNCRDSHAIVLDMFYKAISSLLIGLSSVVGLVSLHALLPRSSIQTQIPTPQTQSAATTSFFHSVPIVSSSASDLSASGDSTTVGYSLNEDDTPSSELTQSIRDQLMTCLRSSNADLRDCVGTTLSSCTTTPVECTYSEVDGWDAIGSAAYMQLLGTGKVTDELLEFTDCMEEFR